MDNILLTNMKKYQHPVTPSVVQDDLKELCEELVPGERPVYVEVVPIEGVPVHDILRVRWIGEQVIVNVVVDPNCLHRATKFICDATGGFLMEVPEYQWFFGTRHIDHCSQWWSSDVVHGGRWCTGLWREYVEGTCDGEPAEVSDMQ